MTPLPTSSSLSSRKFQVAINSSTTTTTQESYSIDEKEKKTTLKQSCIITDDLPPTIELIAYKCGDGGDVSGGGCGDAGREGRQISGYEADTDDTLNSREMKLWTMLNN